mmetsp:Transcript_98674/g.159051  ORF Transcript_98674/g.159051 Transcript_98674/m.159051 type:complete len:111 (+) Transcript_98674:329-661(+)
MLAQLDKDHKAGVLALPCLMSVRSVKCGDNEVVTSLGFPASAIQGAASSLAKPQGAKRTANEIGAVYGVKKYKLGASTQEQGGTIHESDEVCPFASGVNALVQHEGAKSL